MQSRSSAQFIWFRDASIHWMQQVATQRGGGVGVGVGVGAESRNKTVFYRPTREGVEILWETENKSCGWFPSTLTQKDGDVFPCQLLCCHGNRHQTREYKHFFFWTGSNRNHWKAITIIFPLYSISFDSKTKNVYGIFYNLLKIRNNCNCNQLI